MQAVAVFQPGARLRVDLPAGGCGGAERGGPCPGFGSGVSCHCVADDEGWCVAGLGGELQSPGDRQWHWRGCFDHHGFYRALAQTFFRRPIQIVLGVGPGVDEPARIQRQRDESRWIKAVALVLERAPQHVAARVACEPDGNGPGCKAVELMKVADAQTASEVRVYGFQTKRQGGVFCLLIVTEPLERGQFSTQCGNLRHAS